jgi:hypothetical protein
MRILVVEDEWLIAAMVVNALHSTQHEVVGRFHQSKQDYACAASRRPCLAGHQPRTGRQRRRLGALPAPAARHPRLFTSGTEQEAHRASDVALGC